MTDVVDSQARSRIMAGIRGKDTKPERTLRRVLHARGFRFRLNVKNVAGCPDLVLPKYSALVFVHGCFWHRHEGCRYTTTPSTRLEFWQAKFEANVARDNAIRSTLLYDEWRVAIVWECALRKLEQAIASAELLSAWLMSSESQIEIGEKDAH
ncbi:MAG: very short patch repair endonuclease [Rhizobiales bacterium 32-66-11]|nr:MAG: very short patch repair endonuclease [Rhizobiales bacterium 32-66-11]